jgi:hypothetical protein
VSLFHIVGICLLFKAVHRGIALVIASAFAHSRKCSTGLAKFDDWFRLAATTA